MAGRLSNRRNSSGRGEARSLSSASAPGSRGREIVRGVEPTQRGSRTAMLNSATNVNAPSALADEPMQPTRRMTRRAAAGTSSQARGSQIRRREATALAIDTSASAHQYPSETFSSSTHQPAEKRSRRTVAANRPDTAASTHPTSVSSTGEPSGTVWRTYNLRASTLAQTSSSSQNLLQGGTEPANAAAAVAIITPRTPTFPPQIDFPEAVQSSAATAPSPYQLPPGVVNIFDRRHRDSAVAGLPTSFCKCPADRCVLNDTSLGFSHLANYGQDQGKVLREAEGRQLEAMKRLLPLDEGAAQDSSTVDTNSEFSDDDDDDSSSIEDSSAGRGGPVNRRMFGEDGGGGAPSVHHRLTHPSSEAMVRQPYLSPKMREVLIHWLVEVGQEYKVSETAFHLSVSILDHLLLKGPTQDELDSCDDKDEDVGDRWFLVLRSEFQAVGCACAWIASKLEDKNAPSVEDFVWISDYSFTCNRLRSLEEQVCRELEFRLSCITPFHFVNLFLRASNGCPNGGCEFDHPVLRQVVMYLLVFSRLSYQLSLSKPSLLAAAAVYLARATVGIRESDPAHAVHPEGFWTRTLENYTGYKLGDLRDSVLIIHRYQLGAEKAENMKGIFSKFSKSSHHYASLKTALRVEDLGFETRFAHDNMDFEAMAQEPV